MRNPVAATVSVAALTVVSAGFGVIFVVACSQGQFDPGTSSKEACDTVAGSGIAWWLSVLWPGVVLIGLHLALKQKHVFIAAAISGILMLAFWIPLLVVV